MSADLVSILMPVKDTESYLADCLDSIRIQSHINIELIAVDDGCPGHDFVEDGRDDPAMRHGIPAGVLDAWIELQLDVLTDQVAPGPEPELVFFPAHEAASAPRQGRTVGKGHAIGDGSAGEDGPGKGTGVLVTRLERSAPGSCF